MTNSVAWSMHRTPDEYNADGSQKAVLTIVTSDGTPIIVPTTSHHYKAVLQAITDAELNGEELDEARIRLLTSISFNAGVQLRNLSKRVQYDGQDTILFDGDPVNGKIAEHLIELVKSGKPVDSLVKFLEKAALNKSEYSLGQLYDFISRHDLTLTTEGNVIAYKGVMLEGGDPTKPVSIHAGPGIVDGVTYTHANLPNHKGAGVSIPRSYVDDNQSVGCSRGLHVGTFNYASGFAQGMTLTCEFDPADVVSVPEDCNFQKIRVVAYTVLDTTEQAWVGPLYGSANVDGWDDDDYYEGEDLREWSYAGIDEEDAVNFIDQGYTIDEALEEIEQEEEEGNWENGQKVKESRGDLSDWVLAGFSFDEAKHLIEEGWDITTAVARRSLENSRGNVWPAKTNGSVASVPAEDVQVDGQVAIDLDGLNTRAVQDALVEAEGRAVDVRRLKVKENADGTLRRATLILKGDKKSKNRVHIYFNEDGSFAKRVIDKA